LKRIDATYTSSEASRGAMPLVPVNPNNSLGFVLAG